MDLDINEDDLNSVKKAIEEGGKIWDNELLKDFKRKIKEYNRYLQGEQCCYCRKNFGDEFNMVIDIEHILPKGKYKSLMFETFNLSIACKRCNMEIKGEDISFITDNDAVTNDPKNSDHYKLIHPNLDDYFTHIRYVVRTINAKTIVKYKILNNSLKGNFTYKYFELSEIESESYSQAQGIKVAEKLAQSIEPNLAKEIEQLLKKI
jgi:uncharacterized protein (TIGR02646 family)